MSLRWLGLISLLLLAGCPSQQTSELQMQKVNITASDGWKLVADYYPPNATPFSGVVLLHMLPSDRTGWREFAPKLVAAGYGALAPDDRGHGDSALPKDYTQFTNADFAKRTLDVEAAVTFLKSKGASSNKFVLIGASIGANTALAYAAVHPEQVSAVVLLSPGLDYRGITTEDKLTNYTGPLFIAVSKGDSYSYNSSLRLVELAPSATLQVYEGSAHGTTMFFGTDVQSRILGWLKKFNP